MFLTNNQWKYKKSFFPLKRFCPLEPKLCGNGVWKVLYNNASFCLICQTISLQRIYPVSDWSNTKIHYFGLNIKQYVCQWKFTFLNSPLQKNYFFFGTTWPIVTERLGSNWPWSYYTHSTTNMGLWPNTHLNCWSFQTSRLCIALQAIPPTDICWTWQ